MNRQGTSELGRRIAELRRLNAAQAASLELIHREQAFTRALLATTPHGVVACDAQGTLIMFNGTACRWHGMDAMALPPEQWAGHYDLYCGDGTTPLPTEQIPLFRAFNGERVREAPMAIAAKGQPLRYIVANGDALFDGAGTKLGAVVVMTDVSERKVAEDALRQSLRQEEIIRAQDAALLALSTPLIPISDRAVVMPIIGALDARRAEQVMETILRGIVAHRADTVIIDVTGVAAIDIDVATSLIRTAQAVRLLGAGVSLTGIRPELAQILVGLGVDWRGITIHGTLESAIMAALNRARG
jgi:rsbT co-antagonist protein RsbR